LFEPAEMASVVKDFVLTAADLTARYALRCLFPFLILYVVISVWPQWPTGWGIAALLGTLLRLAITLIVPWKTGRLVAERHPGKELPAFVTIYVAALALIELSSALGIPGYSIVSAEPWVVLRWNEIPTPWNPALMLFSMVLVRHRFLRNEVTPA
jgi:hypothetical protein